MISKYAERIVRWRYPVLFLSVIAVLFLGKGGENLAFSNDYRIFFGKDNPQLQAFENLQNTYTKNDNVMFVVSPKSGDVFQPKVLQALQEITEEAWQTPYSIRVDSITNFQNTESEEDDLIVEDLVLELDSYSEKDLQHRKQVALNEPQLANRIISENALHTGVNVVIQFPGKDLNKETPEVVAFARNLKEKMLKKYPEIEIRLIGMVMMNNAFAEASMKDMQTLVPLSFLMIAFTLILLSRSISATIITIFVIMFSIMAAMGTAGWLGIKLTPPSASAPTIILTLAVADSTHLIVTLFHEMNRGMDKNKALIESLRINFMPIFLTSLTTALGFLTMNFSDSPPFHDLGNIAAMGVAYAFILSITFLPAAISIFPMRNKKVIIGSNTMDKLGRFVVRKYRPLFWITGLVTVILISFLPRNELNDVFVEYFDETVEFRTDTDFAADNLTGTYFIDYSIPAGNNSSISEPVFLQQVDRFVNWYKTQPGVLHVNTITDTFRRLNKNMHGDNQDYYTLPEERDLAAQYLLLYEMSLPYGLDLNNQINVQKTATRVSVTFDNLSSNEILAIEKKANEWMRNNTPDLVTDGASPTVMFAHIGKRNIRSMLIGTTVALILISLILIVALKSFKYGLISFLPNLLPAAAAFGLWGLLVGEVGLSLSVVTAMTLGIVVDDTIHFLSKYLRARREKNLSAKDAVEYAFSNVGVALWVTSAVLVAGFMILSLSSFELNSGMGLMTSIVISLALVICFLLLPPVLIKTEEAKS